MYMIQPRCSLQRNAGLGDFMSLVEGASAGFKASTCGGPLWAFFCPETTGRPYDVRNLPKDLWNKTGDVAASAYESAQYGEIPKPASPTPRAPQTTQLMTSPAVTDQQPAVSWTPQDSFNTGQDWSTATIAKINLRNPTRPRARLRSENPPAWAHSSRRAADPDPGEPRKTVRQTVHRNRKSASKTVPKTSKPNRKPTILKTVLVAESSHAVLFHRPGLQRTSDQPCQDPRALRVRDDRSRNHARWPVANTRQGSRATEARRHSSDSQAAA
jgi:hypothetical protein